MKKSLLVILLIIITLSCCNIDDNSKANPIDQLPSETQVGANTFGCLLDGELFIADNLPNSTNCFYQLISSEYYFVIGASNYNNNILKVIRLRTEKKQIYQGETYDLYEWVDGKASGNFTLNNLEYFTSQNHSGKLSITKLDQINQIVSGTFWFDVQDTNGLIHEIREGRFDFQYTK